MKAVQKQRKGAHLTSKFSPPSDVIAFKTIETGAANAGNGGNGSNYGNIINKPDISFDPYNKAIGSHVDVNTGDHVYQKAYWDAGGANGGNYASKYGGNGGTAKSNGDQSSYSGHDTSKVHADTTACQTNFLWADQSQQVYAGVGGNGGDDNFAEGGSVDLLQIPVT